MSKSSTLTIRLDPDVKAMVEEIYAYYGMSLSDAINGFFHKSMNVMGLPFDLRPNQDTMEALREARDIKLHPEKYKGYKNVQNMFDDILSED